MVSRERLSGTTPSVVIRPWVVLRPTIPQRDAGIRTEPPVSLPIAAPARPAATATPEPLLEPPGTRWDRSSQGFRGVPSTALVPQAPKANSTIWVFPSKTAPAAI